MKRNWVMYLLVFVAGSASLATEVTASRLVGPFFGTSVLIWAVLIGNTLVYLTIGYALGGRLADRSPHERTLYQIAAIAGFCIGLVPFVARPILLASISGFETYDAGVLAGSLIGFNLLFAVPLILLGMVSPFAIRIAMGAVQKAGNAAGSVYALSTLGSIVGAYAPVFLVTPRIGADATFLVFAGLLLLTSLWGMVRGSLRLLILVAGIVSLAVELTASRLLGPYFGTSVQIWAVLIGMTLIYLTIGYELGGRLADRSPREATLYRLSAVAALIIGAIPFLAMPTLAASRQLFAGTDNGFIYGALVGVNLLFAIPTILLGMIPPFAIRLAAPMRTITSAGHTAGSLYALSTVGSIVGTFAPVLVLVPTVGTRNTFLFFAFALLSAALLGMWRAQPREGAASLPNCTPSERAGLRLWVAAGGVMAAVVVVFALLLPNAPVKPLDNTEIAEGKKLIYETESLYNYIRVIQIGDYTLLELNEGQAIHSLYNPKQFLTGGVWDYFLVAPYFANDQRPANIKSMALIGSAAGTIAKQYTKVYGAIPIDGAEIDPAIVDVARKYFGMTDPNFHVFERDGRYFLRDSQSMYDIIAVDAYRPPYIPFHLTTKEFFTDIKNHLNDDGVLAINAGHTLSDYGLVDVLASTMKAVFPNVYVLDVPLRGSAIGNSLVIATKQPTKIANFKANLQAANNQTLLDIGNSAQNLREVTASTVVFTDDLAPVEEVVHRILIHFVLTGQ